VALVQFSEGASECHRILTLDRQWDSLEEICSLTRISRDACQSAAQLEKECDDRLWKQHEYVGLVPDPKVIMDAHRTAGVYWALSKLFCDLEAEKKKKKIEELRASLKKEKEEAEKRKSGEGKKEKDKEIEEEEEDAEESSDSTTIIIVVVVVVLLVIVIVTGVAYKKKVLCFKESSKDKETKDGEATGQSPLLKNANYSSRVSPSRTTTASTSRKSRPSSTTLYGN